MNKNDEIILVVSRENLFQEGLFEGYRLATDLDYESRILRFLEYKRRGNMEGNAEYKQPIPYMLLINRVLRKVFAYKRAENERYVEKRLKGMWSLGVGGHIQKGDESDGSPIWGGLFRELQEEISTPLKGTPYVLGYINSEGNAVGKDHFGILYIVETDSIEVYPKGSEIAEGRLMSLEELTPILTSSDCILEEWSEIALEPLKITLRNSEIVQQE